MRRLNRYVEEQAPWQLAKDEAQAGELDVTLRSLAEGLRAVTVLLHPYMPETRGEAARRARRARTSRSSGRRSAPAPAAARVGKLAPLFPKPQ